MEFLEGETLAARLTKGPLPIAQALRATRSRLRRRSTKRTAPASCIAISSRATSSRPQRQGSAAAKLLDFGLAKAMTPADRRAPHGDGGVARICTAPGLILGTVPYMAPEQIEGKEADARTDLFAFGSVLFEMLTGRKAFQGDSHASLMAAILEREPPPLSSLQPLATPALERIVRNVSGQGSRRSLADRTRSPARAAVARRIGCRARRRAQRPFAASQTVRSFRRLTIVALGAVAAGAYLVGTRTTPAPPAAVRVDRLTDFPGLEEYPAISPDGRSVAFTADEGGRRQIWVKLIAGGAPLQLTRDASEHLRPRWSPDSSSLIYFSPPSGGGPTGTLWEISALGGAPRRIVDSLADGDVSHDGRRLAFVRSAGGRLELVTADRDGTNAKVIVPLAAGYSYVSPRWSPDDTLIAYQRNRMSLDDDVFVVPASGGEPRGITQANNRMSGFAWLPDGSGIVMSSSRGSTLYYLPSFNLWRSR